MHLYEFNGTTFTTILPHAVLALFSWVLMYFGALLNTLSLKPRLLALIWCKNEFKIPIFAATARSERLDSVLNFELCLSQLSPLLTLKWVGLDF